MVGKRDPLSGQPTVGRPKGVPALLATTAKPAKPRLSWAERMRLLNVSARCGDGCLDKLIVTIRRSHGRTFPIVDGAMVVGNRSINRAWRRAAAGAGSSAPGPFLLLGVLSGSAPRREALRCTWISVPALAHQVRVLFVVGRASAENRSDVLAVDVVEGAFMRSRSDALTNRTRTFDPKKLIRTGSVTTYWKLVEWLKYASVQPERMVGRADDGSGCRQPSQRRPLPYRPRPLPYRPRPIPYRPRPLPTDRALSLRTAPGLCLCHALADVFISPRMLIAHSRLLYQHATAPRGGGLRGSGLVYAGVFEWYSWRTRTLMSTGFGLSAGASRTRRKKAWRNCTADGSGSSPADPCTGPVAFAKGPLMLMSTAAVRAVVRSPLFARDVAQAHALSRGEAKAYVGPGSGRIDDDVQLCASPRYARLRPCRAWRLRARTHHTPERAAAPTPQPPTRGQPGNPRDDACRLPTYGMRTVPRGALALAAASGCRSSQACKWSLSAAILRGMIDGRWESLICSRGCCWLTRCLGGASTTFSIAPRRSGSPRRGRLAECFARGRRAPIVRACPPRKHARSISSSMRPSSCATPAHAGPSAASPKPTHRSCPPSAGTARRQQWRRRWRRRPWWRR